MNLANEVATANLAKATAPILRSGDMIGLSGGLGSGKTTFVRHLLAALGHAGEVPSPSFAMVIPYRHDRLGEIIHADLYRVEHSGELAELGLDSSGRGPVTLIEWPEHAGPAAWPDALRLTFAIAGPQARVLTASVPAAWEGRWPPPDVQS